MNVQISLGRILLFFVVVFLLRVSAFALMCFAMSVFLLHVVWET